MPRSARLLVLAMALLGTSCTADHALAPPRNHSATPPALARQYDLPADVTGVTGEGALYGMYVPANWNGTLVLWAHGYNDPSLPLTISYSHFVGIRLGLLAQGYAVALSSYSENGWAVIDGAARMHQLVGLFTARFEKPDRVYLIGRSMGSLVATKLAEEYPAQYDGILAYCGFLGGFTMFMDYNVHTLLLFHLYYPGVLPGDPFEQPPLAPASMLDLARNAMLADATGMYEIETAMAAIGLPLTTVPADHDNSLRNSILTALGYDFGGYDEVVSRGHGDLPFDNWDRQYPIAEVEDDIQRHRAHADALNFMQRAYQPTGKLKIPMVTLDILWDNASPIFHKDAYQAVVNAEGASDLLYRIAAGAEYRHCPSSATPVLAAFQTLVTWVETGVHP